MAKYGLLFPYEEIVENADIVIREMNADVVCNKVISSMNSVNEARKAVEAGADIIVARGYQAMLIKKSTNIPLVELRLHAQEIGILLKQAKSMLKKERPKIGLVVFSNMLGDMSCMEELFDVDLLIETINKMEDAVEAVGRAASKGAELFIGGDAVSNAANLLGYPALVYKSSLESVREALREAQRMAYVLETERKIEAQFETVLDTTFNGIIKLNHEGNITVINKLVEGLIGKNLEDVIGKQIDEVFPDFDKKLINDILSGKSDSCTTSVNLRGHAWVLMMAPIQYEEVVTGAILSLQKISENIRRGDNSRKNMFLNGFVAKNEFKNLESKDGEMNSQIAVARKYALSDSPILIYAEEGTEYFPLAESIHNGSARRNGPFVHVNIGALSAEEQMETIFGKSTEETGSENHLKSAAVRANHGTLFLKGIEKASPQIQYQILRVIRQNLSSARTDFWSVDELNVRLITSSETNLQTLADKGNFSKELFYLLCGLVITIPPLRLRKADLADCFEENFSQFCKKYTKFLNLTNGAREKILSFPWEGNLIQIRSFCERLVLTADKRNVDEVIVQNLYELLYSKRSAGSDIGRLVVYRSPEARELKNLFDKYHGNRKLIARELGISTTTLWRKMKKLGVEPKYNTDTDV